MYICTGCFDRKYLYDIKNDFPLLKFNQQQVWYLHDNHYEKHFMEKSPQKTVRKFAKNINFFSFVVIY